MLSARSLQGLRGCSSASKVLNAFYMSIFGCVEHLRKTADCAIILPLRGTRKAT
jgi:hypothetical protein